MKLRIPTFIYPVVLLFLATNASSAEIDITQHILEIMKCTTSHYETRADAKLDFDEEAHEWAWTECADVRNSLIQALPPAARPEWESKLARINRSLAEAIKPKESGVTGYGLNPAEPVMVGGVGDGPRRTYQYFSRLRSPTGTTVNVERIGSCCRFKTPNARIGEHAPLDKYEVTYDDLGSPIVVYVNIYDEGIIEPIKGFTLDDT